MAINPPGVRELSGGGAAPSPEAARGGLPKKWAAERLLVPCTAVKVRNKLKDRSAAVKVRFSYVRYNSIIRPLGSD